MNANGQLNDPTDENELSTEISSSEGEAKEVSNVLAATQPNPTPGSAEQTKQAHKNSKAQTEKTGLAGLIQFIADSLVELKKITWPDRPQVIRETLSVIVLVAIITGCVLGFDYGIAKLVFEPLDKLARKLGGGIGVHH